MAALRSVFVLLMLSLCGAAHASTTSFHYTGTLTDTTVPMPTGSYDFRVRLYDGAGAGAAQVGGDVLLPAVAVTAGFFSVDLDFGSAILTPSAWLEFAVKAAGDPSYETLAPRQQVGHVPLALYAETTDWSGVANVPQSLRTLADSPAPAIGKLLITPTPTGAPSDGLAVHRITFTTTRAVNSGTPQAPTVDGFEAWVEPSQALPALMTAMTAGTSLTKADLFLDLTGNVAPTDYFAELAASSTGSGPTLVALTLEPASAGAPALVHLTFQFSKIEFRIEGGTDYAYDLTAGIGGAVPGVCTGFLSTLEYPFALNGGLVTLGAPNVLDGFVAGVARFNPPQWSAALDPAHVTTARRLAICSLALVTKNQLLTAPVTWVSYPDSATKPDGWTTRMTWTTVYVSGFTLSSDYSGAVKASVEFAPVRFQVESKLSSDDPMSAAVSCWNTATVAPC
jgi:hypothetical protein